MENVSQKRVQPLYMTEIANKARPRVREGPKQVTALKQPKSSLRQQCYHIRGENSEITNILSCLSKLYIYIKYITEKKKNKIEDKLIKYENNELYQERTELCE